MCVMCHKCGWNTLFSPLSSSVMVQWSSCKWLLLNKSSIKGVGGWKEQHIGAKEMQERVLINAETFENWLRISHLLPFLKLYIRGQ